MFTERRRADRIFGGRHARRELGNKFEVHEYFKRISHAINHYFGYTYLLKTGGLVA